MYEWAQLISWGRFLLFDGDMNELIKIYARANKFDEELSKGFKKRMPF